jgi:hypothetical protein
VTAGHGFDLEMFTNAGIRSVIANDRTWLAPQLAG